MLRTLAIIAISAGIGYFGRSSTPVLPSMEQTLRSRGQALVDGYLGPGHAQVQLTVETGYGHRHRERTTLGPARPQQRQSRRECYANRYLNEVTSEKLTCSGEREVTDTQFWVERISVAVIVDRPAPTLEPLLRSGLGLDARRDSLTIQVRCDPGHRPLP